MAENISIVCTTIPSTERHRHTVIFLHGRDSLADELAEDFFLSKSSDDRTLAEIFPTVKWVFPTSKMRDSARHKEELGSFAHLLEPISQWFDFWDILGQPSSKT